jgi:dTDP-glucose 4,6-dehydratase
MKKTILLTGTLGFIFSNFLRRVIDTFPEYRWVGVDCAVKDHHLNNTFNHPNYTFYLADIANAHVMDRIFQIEKPDIILNGCAQSHVDDSERDILPFIHSNVLGVQILINSCLKYKVERFIQISTDEVMGQKLYLDDPAWTEEAPLRPRNPYATSKACAEMIVETAHKADNLQYNIIRSCNVFGARQQRINLIPMIIHALLDNKPITIHGTGKNFRQYIFVEDEIDALMTIIKYGSPNHIYNVSAPNFYTNLQMVETISNLMDRKPNISFIPDRKVQDFGYKVSSQKLQDLGWKPSSNFEQQMVQTIRWFQDQHKGK